MSGIERVRCPKCGQNEKLYVVGLAWFTVPQDGAEQTGKPDGNVEWEKDAPTRCPSCGHEGTWVEFRYEEEDE
jgi:DNA-directed RNA polymerase subunit RPC12/RpoP